MAQGIPPAGGQDIARFALDKKEIPFTTPVRLVIISDTHISDTATNFNKDIFLRGVEAINQIKHVDHLIHLGDITDSGTKAEYECACQLFDRLRPELRQKLVSIPGNHDSKNVGDRLYEQFISDTRDFTIELPGNSVILGLDSTEPDEDTGEIGFRTMNMFKGLLAGYSGLKIVCFHHQLLPIPKTGRERSAITDAGNVLKVLLDANVNLVLNGHRHITNTYSITDGDGELIAFNAGTFSANKTRYHQLWTYTIVDITPNDITFDITSIKDAVGCEFISRPFFAAVEHDDTADHGDRVASIVHMSNTGFSSKGAHDEKAWEAAVRKVNELGCDLVVHCGNLVEQSYKEDFLAAKALLKDIEPPLACIPGFNETFYPVGWKYFQDHVGPLDPVHEKDDLLFMGVNSCQAETRSGVIGRRVLNKVLQRGIHELPSKIVVVGLYHDIVPPPLERWTAPLSDAGDVLSAFALSGLDLVLSGNSFSNWSVQVENAVFSSCGSVCNKKARLYREIGNCFSIIDVYRDGTVKLDEYQVQRDKRRQKRTFKIPIFI